MATVIFQITLFPSVLFFELFISNYKIVISCSYFHSNNNRKLAQDLTKEWEHNEKILKRKRANVKRICDKNEKKRTKNIRYTSDDQCER